MLLFFFIVDILSSYTCIPYVAYNLQCKSISNEQRLLTVYHGCWGFSQVFPRSGVIKSGACAPLCPQAEVETLLTATFHVSDETEVVSLEQD